MSVCMRVRAPAIELKPDYVRALVRRAELHEKTDKLDEALEDYRAALQLEPSQATARDACMVRTPLQHPHTLAARWRLKLCLNISFLFEQFI